MSAAIAMLLVVIAGGVVVLASRDAEPVMPAQQPLPVPDSLAADTSDADPGRLGVPTAGDGESWIVYEAWTGRRQTLLLARSDGTDVHEVVPELAGGNQEKPFWSPDGMSIVFVMDATPGTDDTGVGLFTVGADGSQPTALVECSDDCVYLDDPAWSPDGDSVVYARMTDTVDGSTIATLERIDLATGSVDVLVTAEPLEFFAGPRWAPDGRSIVFEVVSRAEPVIDADVTGVRLAIVDLGQDPPAIRDLTDPATLAVTPDWSPTGDLIVYAAPPTVGSDSMDLYTISPDGGPATQLTHVAAEGGAVAFPSFDPTGERVIFTKRTDDSVDGVIASIDLSSIDDDGTGRVTTLGDPEVTGTHARERP